MSIEGTIDTIAPQFIGVDKLGAIEIAEMRIPPNLCGNKRPLLVAYLAAHILTIANHTAGTDGSIASITESKLSVSYSNVATDINNSLTMSRYGREYDTMSRSCGFTPRVRMS